MSRPAPHLLMTADAVGGVWTYALDLGRGLTTAGVRMTLAVLGPAPDSAQLAQAAEVGLEMVALSGALDWTAPDEGAVETAAARLLQLATRLHPDLVHLNSPALAAFAPFPAPVLAACHSCVKTWWAAVRGEAPVPEDLAWRAALVARGYAEAAALVAPSRAFAEATRAAYDLPTAPHVVPNGRSFLPCASGGGGPHEVWWKGRATPEDYPEAAAAATPPTSRAFGPRHLPRSAGEETHVLAAGRLWDEGKDVATLDRAVGRVGMAAAAAGPLAGPNGQTVALRHLEPLGRLSEAELASRLAARPIFVSPSLYEPFGLAVLEAAQHGCPLVLSDIATFRELWDGAALFFPPGDDIALADALQRLAADTHRCERLGEAAQARAVRYTADAMTDATLALYATLSPAFDRVEAAA